MVRKINQNRVHLHVERTFSPLKQFLLTQRSAISTHISSSNMIPTVLSETRYYRHAIIKAYVDT